MYAIITPLQDGHLSRWTCPLVMSPKGRVACNGLSHSNLLVKKRPIKVKSPHLVNDKMYEYV